MFFSVIKTEKKCFEGDSNVLGIQFSLGLVDIIKRVKLIFYSFMLNYKKMNTV